MAKTGYLDIPPEYESLIKKHLVSSDRFIIPRVRVKKLISRRKLLKGITQKSLLPEITNYWNNLDSNTKILWTNAGLACGLTGYKCFVKEFVLRKQNGIDTIASPSVFHQGKVGMVVIEEPCHHLVLRQDHPITYYINKKVKNTKNQYEPKLVTEFVSFPFDLYISYKSNLTAISSDYRARIYLYTLSNYQGRDIESKFEINFDLNSDWQTKHLNVESVFGKYRFYKVEIEFFNVTGTFYFDNFKLYHSLKNWARDTQCNDIHQDFTRAFYQVSKHWIADVISEGANFESVYPD